VIYFYFARHARAPAADLIHSSDARVPMMLNQAAAGTLFAAWRQSINR
jgi:hypothetical protein